MTDTEKETLEAAHEECRKLVEAWDNGEMVSTIEMGGLGPSYEQCIQICAVEMLRVLWRDGREWGEGFLRDDAYAVVGKSLEDHKGLEQRLAYLGRSGAQHLVALNLALNMWFKGVAATRLGVSSDRHIMVSRYFPFPASLTEEEKVRIIQQVEKLPHA